MQPVIHPFLVGAQIGDRRFDFHDDDFAVAAERHQIGAPAGRQRQFAHDAIAERMQITGGAARDGQRRLDCRPSTGNGGSNLTLMARIPGSGRLESRL